MDAPDAQYIKDYPLQVHAIGPSWGDYGYNTKIKSWLHQNAPRYGHIIIHGLWQYHGHAASSTLNRLGIPYYVFTHGMLDPWFKTTYPLKHAKKLIYWIFSEYWTLKSARKVFFTSEEEKIRARESFWLYKTQEAVVSYGTSSPPSDKAHYRAQFFQQHPDLKEKELLLFLSRIHPKKGCDLLIEAFSGIARKHPNTHLLMAGPGDEATLSALQSQAQHLGVADRISWLGMVKGEQKWAAFHAAQAFVLPSHQENFGIAVAEALGCSLPVLISDKINIWREIQADQAGIVHVDTLDGTVRSLRQWLSLETAKRQAMATAARASFQKRYTVEAMAAGLLAELENSVV